MPGPPPAAPRRRRSRPRLFIADDRPRLHPGPGAPADPRPTLRFFRAERAVPRFEPIPEAESLDGQPAALSQRTWSVSTPTTHHFAQVHHWTAAEWEAMARRPTDVQQLPDGSRIALRIA